MKSVSVEFSEKEMRHLAEMAAFVLSFMTLAKQEDARSREWQRLAASILKAARGVPSIGKDMEINPELKQWFFKPEYTSRAFFSALVDDIRDSLFWSELVERMADHTLLHATPPDELATLTEDDRRERTEALEAALWYEVTHHGIDRLIFMLPESEP